MSDILLHVPEPKIDLYETGFEGVCRLNRASDGRKLSDLMERISEPMVVALDAPWGAGKSVFLKCWVGAHSGENGGKAKTVYFDAFRHDFLVDPLIGITGAIADRFGTCDKESTHLKRAKEAASKLALPVFRIGLAIASAGASELAGPVVDAGLAAGSKNLEKASAEFWRKEDGKKAAMQGFREALEKLATDEKIVIVVDELDRCRPDYALSLLEVIKHFFDVTNVHFVLGVNLSELANSVRYRYGPEINAEKYLQKFITVSMPLIPPKDDYSSSRIQKMHFEMIANRIGLHHYWKCRWIETYLSFVDHHAKLSLRDVEKIASLAMITPEPREQPEAELHLFTGLLILKILAPRTFEKARTGRLESDEIFSILNLRNGEKEPHRYKAFASWFLVTQDAIDPLPGKVHDLKFELFLDNEPAELLRDVIARLFDRFQMIG